MRILFWILVAAMSTLYGAMLFWSLPELARLSGGLAIFDLRLSGYSLETARAILTALGYEGQDFYLNIQQRLDTPYPALLGGVLGMAHYRLYPRLWATGFSAVAIAGTCFDYLENAAVAGMLRVGPEALDAAMVATASRWTQLKSSADAIAVLAVLVGLIWAGWRRWRKA